MCNNRESDKDLVFVQDGLQIRNKDRLQSEKDAAFKSLYFSFQRLRKSVSESDCKCLLSNVSLNVKLVTYFVTKFKNILSPQKYFETIFE